MTAHHHHDENPHAGQGSVLLDIGGDIGALVVVAPEWMLGHEVEIAPAGRGVRPGAPSARRGRTATCGRR